MALPKIYVFVNERYSDNLGVIPVALSEDGEVLASHFCSSDGFVPHDMGLTSDWKHDAYLRKYPGGFDLELVECLPTVHPGCRAAIEKAREKNGPREAEQDSAGS